MTQRLAFAVVALIGLGSPAFAQDSYTVEPLKDAPPEGLAAPVKANLASEGARILDSGGKPYAEIWLRKAIPASAKPGAAAGTIQFPVLAEGELLGAIRFLGEGHDYRDQTIPKGVYTLRYGIQPVNGDHLGVSPFRDYALTIPAAKDPEVAALPKKTLETKSAESAGSTHPGVWILLAAKGDAKAPAVARDEEKNTWSAVLSLPLDVKGESAPATLPVQLVFSGMAAM